MLTIIEADNINRFGEETESLWFTFRFIIWELRYDHRQKTNLYTIFLDIVFQFVIANNQRLSL